jgi:hypothetical protein
MEDDDVETLAEEQMLGFVATSFSDGFAATFFQS